MAPVLDFFRGRRALPALELDEALQDDGVAMPGCVRLGRSAFGAPREASVLAHELFHVWCRAAAPELRGLTCLVPLFPGAAAVEELVTERLARQLCAHLGIEFFPSYRPEVRADYLERTIAETRAAVVGALRDGRRLERAGRALARLSSFDLAALALADAPELRWPAPLEAEVRELHALLASTLPRLLVPRLARRLCRLFALRGWNDRRRGPLWNGHSPLEVPPRELRRRAGDEDVLRHLWAVAGALDALQP